MNVYIQNNVNTGKSINSSTSKTRTKVDIQQDGNGTSSVTVNGKEWKLDGPGEIHMDENSDSNDSTEPTPTVTPEPEESPTPTPEVLSAQDEIKLSFSQKMKLNFMKINESFRKLFLNFFNII